MPPPRQCRGHSPVFMVTASMSKAIMLVNVLEADEYDHEALVALDGLYAATDDWPALIAASVSLAGKRVVRAEPEVQARASR